MKANHGKSHLLVSGKNNVTIKASGFRIKNTECKKLLGIKVDCGLKFENYLDGVIKKASNKINALSRVKRFMNLSKKCKWILSLGRNLVIVHWCGCAIVAR